MRCFKESSEVKQNPLLHTDRTGSRHYALTVWVACFLFEHFFMIASSAKSCVVDLGLLDLASVHLTVAKDKFKIFIEKSFYQIWLLIETFPQMVFV